MKTEIPRLIFTNHKIKRLKSNEAGAMTIIGMATIIIMVIFAVVLIDIGKAREFRNISFNSLQMAAQRGIMEQNSVGGLKPSSATLAAEEYIIQTKIGFGAYRGKCGAPEFKFKFDKGRHLGLSGVSSKEYTLKTLPADNDLNFAKQKYDTLTIQVKDVTGNFFNFFGNPCTKITTEASATTTGAFDEYGPNYIDRKTQYAK